MNGDWPKDEGPGTDGDSSDAVAPSEGVAAGGSAVPAAEAAAVEVTPVVVAETPAVVVEARPRFGAARAFGILVLTFLAQFAAGIFVLIGAVLLAMSRGENVSSAGAIEQVVAQSTAALLLVSGIFSLAAVLVGGRLFARDVFRDHTANGIGRFTLTAREALTWIAAGAGLSLVYGAVCIWVMPPDPNMPPGPLSKAATAGGASRVAWVLLALLFAPVIEELLFRGLLLRGFTQSWGRVPAGIVVTLLFVAMHLFETLAYWPATVAVAAMAGMALLARLRTGSLAAAAAVHAGYNGVIVAMVLSST